VNDSELAQHCARGDREAQRLLYERCSERIYRLLYRMNPNGDDASDLAQETFVRVFEKIHTFDGTSSLMTWIYRIAVNESLQFRRREKRRTGILVRLARRRQEDRTSPAQNDGGEVLAALGRLPEPERALLVLRYTEGLSYDEMAKVLGKPPGTIASGLNRARQMLRQILSPGGAKKPSGLSIKEGGGVIGPAARETAAAPAAGGVTAGGNEP
jgi:RNA polymerase sigma-70 factor (ECF subfamily)